MYGNYIQIVYKSNDRMFIPGNNRGNAFIIGKDITDGVTKGNMDVLGCLNKSICGNLYRGLYPNDISPKRERNLKLAAVYEIRRIDSYKTIDHNTEQVLWNAVHGAKRQNYSNTALINTTMTKRTTI